MIAKEVLMEDQTRADLNDSRLEYLDFLKEVNDKCETRLGMYFVMIVLRFVFEIVLLISILVHCAITYSFTVLELLYWIFNKFWWVILYEVIFAISFTLKINDDTDYCHKVENEYRSLKRKIENNEC